MVSASAETTPGTVTAFHGMANGLVRTAIPKRPSAIPATLGVLNRSPSSKTLSRSAHSGLVYISRMVWVDSIHLSERVSKMVSAAPCSRPMPASRARSPGTGIMWLGPARAKSRCSCRPTRRSAPRACRGRSMEARNRTDSAAVRRCPSRLRQRLRSLDLDFDEGDRVRRAVHHVVLDSRRPPVGLAGDERDFGFLGAVVNAHDGVGEHHYHVGPAVPVPAGRGAGRSE